VPDEVVPVQADKTTSSNTWAGWRTFSQCPVRAGFFDVAESRASSGVDSPNRLESHVEISVPIEGWI
jgi:hypothetical protein